MELVTVVKKPSQILPFGILKVKKESIVEPLDHERNRVFVELQSTRKQYDNLVKELRGSLQCPVCLEVIRSTPVPVCSNGHLVCNLCVRKGFIMNSINCEGRLKKVIFITLGSVPPPFGK